MKLLIVASMFVFGSLAIANPGVKENTDIGKREVSSHHQVTRCAEGECKINTVTRFKKQEIMLQGVYYGECSYSEQKGIRVSECRIKDTKPKAKIKIKVKIKKVRVRVYKKNRIQVHIAHGPNGLRKSEDNNKTSVKEKLTYFEGLQYTRLLNNTFSIGATVFTNKSASVTMGLVF